MRQHTANLSQPSIDHVRGSKAYSFSSKRKKQPKRLAETKTMSQAEWLNVRKQGIGSSDCAAACGLNPYMSMLELWMIKTGRIRQRIEDESSDAEQMSPENVQAEQVQARSKGRAKAKPKFNQREGFVQDIQQGLQQSVRSVN
ncbi:YqaJ viral recombinase family protein [Acinetobacter sp. 1125_18A]|uniref:YqaJ viral recombinase family protein n=1 Tax=Acinetobacter sp. 1125_18A TaxID=2605959 RepID=UPI00405A12D3